MENRGLDRTERTGHVRTLFPTWVPAVAVTALPGTTLSRGHDRREPLHF